MTRLFFCFDTEDFTSPVAANAILAEAEILRAQGIKGNFNMVGLLCDQLIAWKRYDILSALRHHQLGHHSLGHTMHPTINEYTDIKDYFAARKMLEHNERLSASKIRRATGVRSLPAACPPGSSVSYVAMYAYADMGASLYVDDVLASQGDPGAHYCNLFHIDYAHAMEEHFFTATEADLYDLVEDFAARKYACFYTHPHMALYKEHWDKYNYDKCNRPFGDWIEPPRHSREETLTFYRNFTRFIQLVKADPRFEIMTYGEMADRLSTLPPRIIRPEDMPKLLAAMSRYFAPLTGSTSLSICDLFLACFDLLRGETYHLCGKTYGFLEEPYMSPGGFEVTAEEIRASVNGIALTPFLPTHIQVGEHILGPADWLYAAMAVLCGASAVTVVPRPAQINLSLFPNLVDRNFRGSWLHADSFRDNYLSNRLRLQSWTMRPTERSLLD